MLVKHTDCEILFPPFRNHEDGRSSSNSITKMVGWFGQDTGAKGVDLQKCYRTFGQMLFNDRAGIEEVSALMGHVSIAMTEKEYCRRRQQQRALTVRRLLASTRRYHRKFRKKV